MKEERTSHELIFELSVKTYHMFCLSHIVRPRYIDHLYIVLVKALNHFTNVIS